LALGVHPKVVQEALGHSTIAVTLDLYSHVVPSLQREAAKEMGSHYLDNSDRPPDAQCESLRDCTRLAPAMTEVGLAPRGRCIACRDFILVGRERAEDLILLALGDLEEIERAFEL
jgi:hypothetical protein